MATIGNSTSATSATVTKPASVSAGDTVWVVLGGTGGGFSIPGFTNHIEIVGAAYVAALLSRTLDGSEGSTWTASGGVTGNIAQAARPGAGNVLTLDGTPQSVSAGNGSTATIPATTGTNGGILIAGFASSAGGFTTPGGMTEVADLGASVCTAMDYQVLGSTGSTGTRAATSGGIRAVGVMASFKEVSAAASHPLSGSITGTSAASASRITLSHPLSGSVAGSSAASAAAITESHPLSGSVAGVSAASAARISLDHPLSGSAMGSSSGAAAAIALSHPLSGSAAGESAASAAGIALSHPLSGSIAGTSVASAAGLQLSHPLSGAAIGVSSGSAAGIVVSHPLSGSIAGVSAARALAISGDLAPIRQLGGLLRIAGDEPIAISRLAPEDPVIVTRLATEEPITILRASPDEPLTVERSWPDDPVLASRLSPEEPLTVLRIQGES